ncbi:Slp/YeaY family lipoprotein [Geoalkalibacter sp.]|uniref:Slp/YeaY family lipoprotein n=1 Tax=Geoalkalibacter sp. TaxID=3041440 RepID=UPI00272ED84B|nr:Slp/YeaY family lipoprotein [Geoalkalibacter sp.]
MLLALGGCTHVLPQSAREEVHPYLDLRDVKDDPAKYAGTTLLLGGLILDSEVTREGSRLEILSYNLDRWGRPLSADELSGRFLVETERILDPALYEKGRQVTLTGTLTGAVSRPLGKSAYSYPLLHLRAIYLWPRPDRYDPYVYPYYHPYSYPYRPYPFGWYYPWW